MHYSRILVIADNLFILRKFRKIVRKIKLPNINITYRYSYNNKEFQSFFKNNHRIKPIDIKSECREIIKNFDLLFSLHCKQIFPKKLVSNIKCINIHPGFLPYNRGWFPQTFSILNKLPIGATIHEMTEKIDLGPIIKQIKVPIYSWDTSLSVYQRILAAEENLLDKNLKNIILNRYKTQKNIPPGNINNKTDFINLCKINLHEKGTMSSFIDRLRALSHGDYKNAYFFDKTGKKVFVKIILETNDK